MLVNAKYYFYNNKKISHSKKEVFLTLAQKVNEQKIQVWRKNPSKLINFPTVYWLDVFTRDE